MKIKVSHTAILSPEKCSAEIDKLTRAILGVNDALAAANIAVFSLLQAQVTAPEDAHLIVDMLRVLGGHMASEENNETPELAELLRVIAKVVHNAGMKLDSVVDIKSDKIVVTTE